MPLVLVVMRVPGVRYFSTLASTCCLMSSRSTTTSMIQSQSLIFGRSSSKLPVLMRFAKRASYSGAGLLLIAAARASSTILLRGPSLAGMSSSSTSVPVLAKWQAMRLPMTPLPSTATLRMFLLLMCV